MQASQVWQVAEKLIIAPVALHRWAILQLRYVAGSKHAIWLFHPEWETSTALIGNWGFQEVKLNNHKNFRKQSSIRAPTAKIEHFALDLSSEIFLEAVYNPTPFDL